MKIIPRFIRLTTPIIAVLLLIASGTASDSIDDTIQKSFPVDPGGTLNIDTARGTIEIRAVRGNTVEIEVIRKVKTSDRKKAQKVLDNFEIEFSQSGNDVFIVAEKKNRDSLWDKIWNRLNIKFIVSVPKIYNIKLRTSGGGISVEDLEGKVDIKTSGGSLRLNNITGPVWGKTSGGSIGIGEVNGNIDIHTSGGSIKIDRAQGTVDAHTSGGGITVNEVMGTINAHTSGGSIKAHILRQPESDCRLTTSGGSMTVHLAADIAVDVDAGTSGGSVHTEFPVIIKGKINTKKLKAKINGGGPLLYLHTSGGSIYIKKL